MLLSEDDNIVPSSEVHEYLSDAQARGGGGLRGSGSTVRRLHMMRGQRHGGFLLDAPSKQLVLDTVRDAQSWGAESGARLRDGRRRGPEPPIGRRVRMSWWRGGGGGPFGFVDLSEMGVRVLYVAVGAAGALQERLGALFHLPDWWMTEERSATTPAEARRSRK